MIIEVSSAAHMKLFASKVAQLLKGGEVLELVGDVGAGKTTFVKGLAEGLLVEDEVQSPSFTISRVYEARDNLQLAHYDFYRLNDAGILADELSEVVQDASTITVIEWADIVEGVLPKDRYTFVFTSPSEETRNVDVPDRLAEQLS